MDGCPDLSHAWVPVDVAWHGFFNFKGLPGCQASPRIFHATGQKVRVAPVKTPKPAPLTVVP